MPIEVTRMTEADIDGAIDTIQQAFADDPYNNWVYPDRSKVHSIEQPTTYSIRLTRWTGRSYTKPRVSDSPLPLGHISRSLPRRPRLLQSHQDPRLRNVDVSATALPTRVLVPIPLILVALAKSNPNEHLVWPWRAEHTTVLDLESAAGGGAEGALDEQQGVLLL